MSGIETLSHRVQPLGGTHGKNIGQVFVSRKLAATSRRGNLARVRRQPRGERRAERENVTSPQRASL